MYELALFAGAGGGILGGTLIGWRTVCAVEIKEYPCGVLLQRQNDGILDTFPIWQDVTSFTKRNNQCRGFIKQLARLRNSLVITGGFPCQDISVAGSGAGIDGTRSGLWRHYARLVGEIRPRAVYLENSPMLTSRGLHRVLENLSAMGYHAAWGIMGASDVGANHIRQRLWLCAWRDDNDGGGVLRPTPKVRGEEGYETVAKRKGHKAAIKHNLKASLEADKLLPPFLPTVTVSDIFTGNLSSKQHTPGSRHSVTLAQMVKMMPTVTVNDSKNSTLPKSQITRANLAGELLREGAEPGGELNPAYCEWMMGFPIGWTELQPLATLRFQQWRQQHGTY